MKNMNRQRRWLPVAAAGFTKVKLPVLASTAGLLIIVFILAVLHYISFDGKNSVDNPIGVVLQRFICGNDVDYAGETYPTVRIGTQCWFAKNLDVGATIISSSTPSTPIDDKQIEKYCYGNDPENCRTGGGFYTWYEAMQLPSGCHDGIQTDCSVTPSDPCCSTANHDICPAGWHVPTHYEWTTLERWVSGAVSLNSDFPYDNTTQGWLGNGAGSKLSQYVLDGIDSSGFNALMAGYRNVNGSFFTLETYAIFWTSSAIETSAWNRDLFQDDSKIARGHHYSRSNAYSIRCLKD